MNVFRAILKRELLSYFSTPIGYVFIVVFLAATAFTTFQMGGFFEARQASMNAFFRFLPMLFAVFIPAVAMRMWSEERQRGTVELLFTLPVTLKQAVLAKFLAGWVFVGAALLLTFPMPVTVAYLGDPDWAPILTGYAGALLMAGVFLSLGMFCSTLAKSQVVSFIFAVLACVLFVLLGSPGAIEFFAAGLPQGGVDFLSAHSVINHFESIQRGVLETRDLVYFLSLIVAGVASSGFMLGVTKSA